MKQELETNIQQANSIMSEELRQFKQSNVLLKNIEKEQVFWNPILRELLSQLPKDVVLNSFTGDNTGKITVQLITDEIGTLTRTVELLSESEIFTHVFLPSLSSGKAVDDKTVVTFPLVIEFDPQQLQEEG